MFCGCFQGNLLEFLIGLKHLTILRNTWLRLNEKMILLISNVVTLGYQPEKISYICATNIHIENRQLKHIIYSEDLVFARHFLLLWK